MVEFDSKNILVVGGSGFIGAALTRKLCSIGASITILRLNKGASECGNDNLQYITADLQDVKCLQNCLKDHRFDYVFNASGYIDHASYWNGGRSIINTHFLGLLNLLDSIDKTSLKGFVQLGSSDEYGLNPAPQKEELREGSISPYAVAKTGATHLI